jgi:hypothetical protein
LFDFLVDIIPPEELKGDGVVGMPPPTTAPPMAVPSYVPEMNVPFGIYENQQPLSFKWPLPEQEQEQQTSDREQHE